MANKKSLLDAVKDRRSFYALGKESTISNERIKELVEFTITHAPGAFNVQVSPLSSLQ
jgi:predicted oxidoreductase (fatty acid repression mutant protein)